jgi:hypothetical protein
MNTITLGSSTSVALVRFGVTSAGVGRMYVRVHDTCAVDKDMVDEVRPPVRSKSGSCVIRPLLWPTLGTKLGTWHNEAIDSDVQAC